MEGSYQFHSCMWLLKFLYVLKKGVRYGVAKFAVSPVIQHHKDKG